MPLAPQPLLPANPGAHSTYNGMWDAADRELRNLALTEADPAMQPDPKSPQAQFEHYAVLYIKYIQIFKRLSLAYDQVRERGARAPPLSAAR